MSDVAYLRCSVSLMYPLRIPKPNPPVDVCYIYVTLFVLIIMIIILVTLIVLIIIILILILLLYCVIGFFGQCGRMSYFIYFFLLRCVNILKCYIQVKLDNG
uniref:Uncharacterized protein n=1 Tax=Cacopsylla melanoneura TaxID=428564 RepID=A0A8D8WYS3_9HEMI